MQNTMQLKKLKNKLFSSLAVSSLIVLIIILSSCKTNLVYMNVIEPAPISIPPYLKKMGVVNRTTIEKKNEKFDKVEQILSAEGPQLDKEGALAAIDGLYNELSKNERFTLVKKLPEVKTNTTGSGVFPAQLSWDEINKICTENGLEGLYILEFLDSDTKVSYAQIPTTINTPLGSIPAVEHQANMLTIVKTGWRIYDNVNKLVIDEYSMNRNLNFSGRGINPMAAVNAVMGRKDAVKQAANYIGQDYAKSILPYTIRVNRDYYIKGNYNFKVAMRKARTGNWDGAAELWKKETLNPKRKIAGRACYNMAIIGEINGDLDGAIHWAQQAYENYGNRLALQYVNILKNRKNKNARLKMQEPQ